MAEDMIEDRAIVADPARLNEHLARVFRPFYGDKPPEVRVHPAAFSFEPQGNRLLVVCYPNPAEYGGLKLPEVPGEASGLGVVMAVGRTAFWERAPHPGAGFWPAKTQEKLLYRTVVFGQYAGKPLRLNYLRDHRFNAEILVLTDRDIWCVRFPELTAPYTQEHDYLAVDLEERL